MTLELLHVIRDYNIRLQGHQYQIMQVIQKTWSMHWLDQYIKIQNQIGSSITNNSMVV